MLTGMPPAMRGTLEQADVALAHDRCVLALARAGYLAP